MNHNYSWGALILLAILGLAVIIVGPFLTIWALNTLFPALNIAYTFDTWAAASLGLAIAHAGKSKKD